MPRPRGGVERSETAVSDKNMSDKKTLLFSNLFDANLAGAGQDRILDLA